MLINHSGNQESKTYHVLIVDDSLADFELYRKFLQKDKIYSYSISYAETATEGLNIFTQEKPDFVIMDFSLPDMNGLELISAIQKIDRSPRVPIIMLTGQGNERIALKAMKQNIQDYLVKGNLDYHIFMETIYKITTFLDNENLDIQDQVIEVLLVDDSEIDLELYTRFLSQDHNYLFNIYQATTVKQALDILQNKRIDIVITDYLLPDSDGIELIKHYQKFSQSKDTCIVLLTGQGNEKVVVEALKNGAVDYLIKQFISPEIFRQTIKDNVNKIRLSSQLRKIEFQQNLLSKISLNIRKSLNLDEIINTSVREIKKYLNCDRVVIYQLNPSGQGKIIAEAVNHPFTKTLGLNITDTFFQEQKNREEYLKNCHNQVITDLDKADIDPCHRHLLERFEVKSVLTIPLILENTKTPLWGLLIVHFCQKPHFWEKNEINFLNEISVQISIGIQQGLLIEELKIQRDLAHQATKSKSAFLANMSHEIRTPLNGILGMAEILSLTHLTEEQKEGIAIIQSSSENLLNIINEILDLSRLEAGGLKLNLTEFSLNGILKELNNLFKIIIKKKDLIIDFDIDQDLPDKYKGDPVRLKQILINLINNAIKFTFQGSIIIIISQYNQINNLQENQLELYFAVQDTGIGISLEDQNKLFKAFSQVENSTTRHFEGCGLGLSICKKLVELMGGNIGVKSEINQGSTFWFTAKLETLNHLSAQSSPQEKIDNQTATKFIKKQGKILLVEDNKVNQIVVKSQLKSIGYECDIVENGQIALDVLTEKTYDLILMDCQMPILDGYNTTRAIRENQKTKNLIIIGLTAFAFKEDKEKCISAGMNSYLSKPYKVQDLRTVIEKWI